MEKVKKKDYVFLTNWIGENLKCACLFHNPLCEDNKRCEELELSLLPYEDVEECMRNRRYKRINGAIRQG